MSKKLTLEEFVFKANIKHNNKYDYKKSVYVDSNTKLIITCPEHGDFEQMPASHLSGMKCQKCAGVYRFNTDEFITRARDIHGNLYDYSDVIYVNNKSKVKIKCLKHDYTFEMSPNNHLAGAGCSKCGYEKSGQSISVTYEDFVKRAQLKYGDIFKYDKDSYVNITSPIKMWTADRGYFWRTGLKHLSNDYKSPDSYIKNPYITTESFIKKAHVVHNNKYTYEKVKYLRSDKFVIITCPAHGDFEQTPHAHLKGYGCYKCGRLLQSNKTNLGHSKFIELAKNRHNDKYNYDNTVYLNSYSPVTYVCPTHGEITQKASAHLRYGCAKCGYDSKIVSFSDFLNRAKLIHKDKYTYSDEGYVGTQQKVKIHCHKHGWFYPIGTDHIRSKSKAHGCPRCAESKGESLVIDTLEKLKLNYVRQYSFNNSRYRYDVYLPELNVLIEYDGIQHFEEIVFFGGKDNLNIVQNSDKEKTLLADINKVPLIRISYHKLNILPEYLIYKLSKVFKYTKDDKYFHSFLEFCRYYNLPGDATPEQYKDFLVIDIFTSRYSRNAIVKSL